MFDAEGEKSFMTYIHQKEIQEISVLFVYYLEFISFLWNHDDWERDGIVAARLSVTQVVI